MPQTCLYQVFAKLSLTASLAEPPASLILLQSVAFTGACLARGAQCFQNAPVQTSKPWFKREKLDPVVLRRQTSTIAGEDLLRGDSPQGTKNPFPQRGPSVPVPPSRTGSPRPSPQPCEPKSQGNRKGSPMKSSPSPASPWVPHPPEPNLPAAWF